jgi:hypothetical protein
MPRDAILLSDKRVPTIGIFCALCQRRETFDVESLKLQCEFRRNPAGDSDLMSATVPI